MCFSWKIRNWDLIITPEMNASMLFQYLQDTLGDFIRTILDSGDDCEVDPNKVPNNASLQRHQKLLTMYCEMAWFKIINSHCFFPRLGSIARPLKR